MITPRPSRPLWRAARPWCGGARRPTMTRPMRNAIAPACRRAIAAVPLAGDEARAFFEANFRPMRITPLGESMGFLTGYYEPIVDGSRTQTDIYNVPLHRKPAGLLPGGRRSLSEIVTQGQTQDRCGARPLPTTIAPPSRTARSTVAISRSSGSRIRSTRSSRRSRARCAYASRTDGCCGSTTTPRTDMPISPSAASSSIAVSCRAKR